MKTNKITSFRKGISFLSCAMVYVKKGYFEGLFLKISSLTRRKALQASSALTCADDVLQSSCWILICEEI